MPSNTFFNLLPEKQERLLEAATREFCRKSLGEASINQIIKDAGISRGSFYMYFQDKEDLFRYLLRGYVDQMLSVMEQLLIREQGDIFLALSELYEYMQKRIGQEQLGEIGAMASILSRNAGMHKSAILDVISPPEVVARLGQLVNTERLNLRAEGDLSVILSTLLVLAGPMIYEGALRKPSPLPKVHFDSVLEILKRGMAAKSAATM